MRRDPTQFRERFKRWKEGLPAYKNGKPVDDEEFESFRQTLPDNQKPIGDYRTRRYWELNDKPKTFSEAIGQGMYTLGNSGKYGQYGIEIPSWHANSVAYDKSTGNYEFMKPNSHPTRWMEDVYGYWGPDNYDFRENYRLEKGVVYDRYVPKKNVWKIPKFDDGKDSYRYYQDGQGGWFRAANDDMTRAFEGLVVTPRKTKYTYVPKKIDNSEQAVKWRDEYNATHNPFTGLPMNQGLETVSPEFDILSGVRGFLLPLKQSKIIDYDNVRKEIAKMKARDDAWRAAHPEYEVGNILKKPKLPDAYPNIPENVQKYTIDPITQKFTTRQEADIIEKMLYENKGFHGKQIFNLHNNRARINGDFVEGVGRVYNIDDATDYESAIQWLENNAFGNRDGAIKFLSDPLVRSSSAGFMLPLKDKPIFISKSKLFSTREAQLGRKLTLSEAEDLYWKVVSHERHHAFDKIHNTPEGFDLSNLPLDDYFVKNGSDELAARGTQLKDMFGLVHEPLTAAHLRYASGKYFMDPSNMDNNMSRFFNIITDYEKAAKWLNENATTLTAPVVGGIGYGLHNNK